MLSLITDPDVLILASCSAVLQAEYTDENSKWAGSPFAWIKTRPSRQIGTIGEKLVAGWLATKGFDVVRSPDSQADRIINGRRAEIKLSTLWQGGFYKFQQLRDQNYEFVVCLGISPFDAHCWILEKTLVGRNGEQETDSSHNTEVRPAKIPRGLASFPTESNLGLLRAGALSTLRQNGSRQ